ncbi:MAG TPA: hypothetical protein VFD05_01240 [Bacilli bacterium]|nr:hypothetical protein [Bacilli bacterium]
MKNKVDYEKLAKSLHLELSDAELEQFTEDFAYFLNLTKVYDALPALKTAEPLIFPFPVMTSELEEDEVNEKLYVDIKLNTENTKDNYITLPKVVK